MLSVLELRHLIESAFLPVKCCCRVESPGYLQVEIFDSESRMRELLVKGIPIADLSGSQAIGKLARQIRTELHAARLVKFSISEKKCERN
jgi:hypothetical protein